MRKPIEGITFCRRDHWRMVELRGRIDSFNFTKISETIDQETLECGDAICIDLTRVEFLSLPAIHYFNRLAKKYYSQNVDFSVLGGNDKTRRHLEIYGDLKFLKPVQEFSELTTEIPPAEQTA